jgi:hypothetical protein
MNIENDALMRNMKNRIILYTVQKPCHDITKHHEPLPVYSDPNDAYYRLVQYLGWKQWAWCLMNPMDFNDNHGWMWFGDSLDHTMWTLYVPAKHIAWCSLDSHCEGYSAKNQIFPDPFSIRANGEIPMGLVQTPINENWVVEKEPARDSFKCADLLDYFF